MRMRRNKTVAQILLIFFTADFVLAAPAVVQRRLDVAETARKRGNKASQQATLESPESAESGSDPYFSAPESLGDSSGFGSSEEEWPPSVSPSASFDEGWECTDHFLVNCWWYDNESVLNHDSAPESPSGSSPQDSASELPSGPSRHNSVPASSLAGSLQHDSASAVPPLPPAESDHDLAPPESQLPDTLFNDALKQTLKLYAGAGAVAGVYVGLTLGVEKLIKDHSHVAYVSALFTHSYRHLTESQTF